MKSTILTLALMLTIGLFGANSSLAEETSSQWETDMQKKYELTDGDMQKLKASGMNQSQAGRAAYLTKNTDKSMVEVLQMRSDQKMGWGKIAKELGVDPGELGKANAEMRKEKNADRRERKTERKSERKTAKKERKQQRKAERRSRKKSKNK